MSEDKGFAVEVLSGLAGIDAAAWDACACPETADGGRPIDPFTTHRFLSALEDSGSASEREGWIARHIAARGPDDRLVGVMPLYGKTHSQGEFVFDHNWAHAFESAGGDYYPKLQASVPFTPATGRRMLTAKDAPEAADLALLQGAMQLTETNELSSLHITFCTEAEWLRGGAYGLLRRQDQQFHWERQGAEDFDAFLTSLASRKRKNLKKERARAVEDGVTIHRLTGDDIRPEHWDAFWWFYQDTGMRKWGRPYLTREFFEIAQANLRDDILLILCERDGRWIAGALNFIGRETLFGRYWGCTEPLPFLHFETCYYQAMDAAFDLGLQRVEAGAQGAHKLARGYLPTPTYSLHYVVNPGFRRAVEDYLERERHAVDEEIEFLSRRGPYRKGAGDGRETY
ncbi:MAG: GNAT family N-acetyltransferase [Pseudomonadota bacterium]